MKPSSAILLWVAVLLALLCTLATLTSLFYIAYGYSTLPTPTEVRQGITKPGTLPPNPDNEAVLAGLRNGMGIHLSPIGPFIFTLAPLCWLYVFWKDRPALSLRDGRISTYIMLACLIIFLVSLAWLAAYSWADARAR